MADNNFRPFRSREPLAREDVDPMSDTARDPLAELARIIGQSDRVNQFDRAPRYEPRNEPRHEAVQTLDEPVPVPAERDWAADDGYAEPDAPEQYPDQYAEENYIQPRLPDPHPLDRADSRYDERAPSIASQYSEPAEAYDDAREDEHGYEERYREDDPPRNSPPGSQPWRSNPKTTNTKPKTNGTTRRIVSLTMANTTTTKPPPNPGAAASSWLRPWWVWS